MEVDLRRELSFSESLSACVTKSGLLIFTADAKNLRALLFRKTDHATFPNIIIGGRSIGGADDLIALDQKGTLAHAMKQAGATVKPL